MRLPEKNIFLENVRGSMSEWYDELSALPPLELDALPAGSTCCVVIDMINGFIKSGALCDSRQRELAEPVADFVRRCTARGINAVAFADTHTPQSIELETYPPHCLAGSEESELIPELDGLELKLFAKNSTNGFIEPEFSAWLEASPQITHFVLSGVCTDICVLQFALSLKAWFNMKNRCVKIILPLSLIDTYSAPNHDGDTFAASALHIMAQNGIELVSDIK